jgi:hypothetical protein
MYDKERLEFMIFSRAISCVRWLETTDGLGCSCTVISTLEIRNPDDWVEIVPEMQVIFEHLAQLTARQNFIK